jgi:ADP-ribose pyrophosphatase YjhB (NUDIX family)
MRKAVRAIIIKDNALLVMSRNKFGEKYETLPGGNIESNESAESALWRELGEETSVQISNPRLVIVENAGLPWGTQYVYLCDYVAGEPTLSQSSEEYLISQLGKNLYEPRWLPLSDLPTATFRSENLKREIVRLLESGWPQTAVEITTT